MAPQQSILDPAAAPSRCPWRRRLLALTLLTAAAGVAGTLPGAQAAEEMVHPGPPSLETAQQQLAESQAARTDAQTRRQELEAELAATRAEINDLGVEQTALARELEIARARVRVVTVRAYTSGGDREMALLFDVGDLGDHLYRNELLTGNAIDTSEAIEDYEELRAAADLEVVELAEAVDDLVAAIDQSGRDIELATEAIGRAEVELSAARAWTSYNASGRTDPGEAAWERLRFCESGGVYSINTGNGFYGAYQFDRQTWESMGGTGLPSDAPYWEQDLRAKALYQARGAQPWPLCGRFLG